MLMRNALSRPVDQDDEASDYLILNSDNSEFLAKVKAVCEFTKGL